MKLIFHNKLVFKIIRFGNQIKLKINYQKIDNAKKSFIKKLFLFD